MIKWITEHLGTAAYSEELKNESFAIVDVRDLVDKSGNSTTEINDKINLALNLLGQNKCVVICCDYGMSRSNSIAVGVLAKAEKIPFAEALKLVLDATKEELKLEVLAAVRKAVDGDISQEVVSREKRILILGASGMLGKEVVLALQDIHKIFYPSREELDLRSPSVYMDNFCRENHINYIINLASPRIANSHSYLGENVLIIKNILEVLKNQRHIHFTNAFSAAVYDGYKGEALAVNEITPLNPDSTYSENQYFCEEIIKYYKVKYDLNILTLRMPICYGVHGAKSKPRFIYNFINKALCNATINTHEYINGLPKLHLLHVKDLADVMELLFSGHDKIGYFNVAGDDFLSTYDIAKRIVELTKSNSTIQTTKLSSLASNIFLDTAKIRRELSWEPKYAFDNELLKIIEQIKKGDK